MGTLILAALVGIAVGVIVGSLGAGGGIISVPVLVYLLHQEPHAATASSLVIVIMAAIAGLPHHATARNIRWRDGGLFALASLAGSVAGARLSVLVDPDVLLLTFSGLLLIVAVIMGRKALALRAGKGKRPELNDERKSASIPVVILAATLTGALTGFFGVGGGFAVVPVLTLVLGFSMIEAAGTSLLVMIIAASAGLVARIGTHVEIDWWLVILFGLGSMAGSAIGAPATKRVQPWILTAIFTGLLVVVAIFTLVRTLMGA